MAEYSKAVFLSYRRTTQTATGVRPRIPRAPGAAAISRGRRTNPRVTDPEAAACAPKVTVLLSELSELGQVTVTCERPVAPTSGAAERSRARSPEP